MSTPLECPSCQCTFDEPLRLDQCQHHMCKQCVRQWATHTKQILAASLESSIDLMGLTDADVVLLTSRGERPKLGDRCAFCQGVETEHEDLVYCDRCNVAVHPGCYHITSVPPGDEPWFCEPCIDEREAGRIVYPSEAHEHGKAAAVVAASSPPRKSGRARKASSKAASGSSAAASAGGHSQAASSSSSSSSRQKCCVCSNRSDLALKRVHEGEYIHLSCSSFLPGLEFMDQYTATPVTNLDAIPEQWFKLKCEFCTGHGATVQCQYARCVRTYHVPCGLQNGCLFSFKDLDGRDLYKDSVCVQHRRHIRDVANSHDKRIAAAARARSKSRRNKAPSIKMPCPVCRAPSKVDLAAKDLGLRAAPDLQALADAHRRAHPDEDADLAELMGRYPGSRAHDNSSDDEPEPVRGAAPPPTNSSRTPVARAAPSAAAASPATSTATAALTSSHARSARARARDMNAASTATAVPSSATASSSARPPMTPSSLARLSSPTPSPGHAPRASPTRVPRRVVRDILASPPLLPPLDHAAATASLGPPLTPVTAARQPTEFVDLAREPPFTPPACTRAPMDIDETAIARHSPPPYRTHDDDELGDEDDEDHEEPQTTHSARTPIPVSPDADAVGAPHLLRAHSEPTPSPGINSAEPPHSGPPPPPSSLLMTRTRSASTRKRAASPPSPISRTPSIPPPPPRIVAPSPGSVRAAVAAHALNLELDGLEILERPRAAAPQTSSKRPRLSDQTRRRRSHAIHRIVASAASNEVDTPVRGAEESKQQFAPAPVPAPAPSVTADEDGDVEADLTLVKLESFASFFVESVSHMEAAPPQRAADDDQQPQPLSVEERSRLHALRVTLRQVQQLPRVTGAAFDSVQSAAAHQLVDSLAHCLPLALASHLPHASPSASPSSMPSNGTRRSRAQSTRNKGPLSREIDALIATIVDAETTATPHHQPMHTASKTPRAPVSIVSTPVPFAVTDPMHSSPHRAGSESFDSPVILPFAAPALANNSTPMRSPPVSATIPPLLPAIDIASVEAEMTRDTSVGDEPEPSPGMNGDETIDLC